MNEVSYNLLTKLMEKTGRKQELDKDILNGSYNFYKSRIENDQQSLITKEELDKFLSIVHGVFSLNINNSEFEIVTKNYMEQITCDALSDNKVNTKWLIDKLWYYSIGNESISCKFRDSIVFAQNKLINEFNIKETRREQINRKIYTKTLLH